MPSKPLPACPVCRRVNCQDERHRKQPRPPRQRTERRLDRPDRLTTSERNRRRRVVNEWLDVHGRLCANGDVIARCPDCRQMKGRFVADHVVPIALGGAEDGELRIHCLSCSGKQGADLANSVRRRGR